MLVRDGALINGIQCPGCGLDTTDYQEALLKKVYKIKEERMKEATCVKSDFKKETDGDHGKMYGFAVGFDNGDDGYYTSKKRDQTNFVVGEKAQYELEEKKTGEGRKWNKIKPYRDPAAFGSKSAGGGGKTSSDRSIRSQVALKAAVEMTINHPAYAGPNVEVLDVASGFFGWLEDRS